MPAREWSFPLTSAHPAAAGGLRLLLDGDADVVTAADAIPGGMHRGAEKLFESRDYRSLLALSDRHAWASSFNSEEGLARLIEAMLGIPVPPRAQWLRVLLGETSRVGHHLVWLAATADYLGLPAATEGHRARAALTDAVEQYTGMRVHHMLCAPGGLRWDCPAGWPELVCDTLDDCLDAARGLGAELRAAIPAGVGVLSSEAALGFATSGPVARASAVRRDQRSREAGPWQRLRDAGIWQLVTGADGDARARFDVLVAEVAVAAACVRVAAEHVGQTPGEVNVQLPKSIRVPEGHGYLVTESPGGANGWYLVSRGGPTPYRLHLRTASFNNAQALTAVLPGTAWDDVPVAVMSMFLVAGDTDK